MPFVGVGIGIGRNRYGTGGTPSGLLLDTYTGAAAAYSLRKLRSGYTGDAIEVRRASDNTTQDIGFVNNELDTSTLATFCSGTDGFVTTWYDQSGNGNDATQTTAANQPKIYDSVSGVITQGTKSSIDFGTTLQNLCLSVNNSTTNNLITVVHTANYVASKNQVILALSDNNYLIVAVADSGKLKYANSNDDMISTTDVGSFQLSTIDINDKKLYINGLEEDSVTTVSGASDRYVIANYTNSGANQMEGYISEIVIWQTSQTSNLSNINNNINDFYSIYYVATNSEYQDVLDYADSQGYQRPSYAQCALQDALVGDLKDAGVWSKLDLLYVFATDGDSDFASINWKDPNNFEITEVNSPTFTTNVGFEGNGTSSYLNTNTTIDIGGNFNESLSIGSFGGYMYNGFESFAHPMLGTSLSTNLNTIRGGQIDNVQSTNVGYDSLTPTEKWFHLNTDSITAEQFVDGVQVRNVTAATSPTDNGILYLMRDAARYSQSPTSIIFTGGDLSSEQGDFYTAVDSYMTSI